MLSETADVIAGIFDFWSLNGLPEAPPAPATMSQFPFLPAGLGANLAVRRQAFDSVDGFSEVLSTGEDIDLCWRLQIAGYRFAIDEGAVVAKRDRTGFWEVFRQAYAFGRGGAVLYRKHRPGRCPSEPGRRGVIVGLAACAPAVAGRCRRPAQPVGPWRRHAHRSAVGLSHRAGLLPLAGSALDQVRPNSVRRLS